MTEMHNFKLPSVNKKIEESLPQCDSPTDIGNIKFDNVQIVNELSNEFKEENIDGKLISKTEDVNTLKTQDTDFNLDTIINQELNASSDIANHVVSKYNNSNKMSSLSKLNDTWSYIEEFDLFLKEYKRNYDNYNPPTTMGSSMLITSETRQFVEDINNYEYEDSKQLLSFPNSRENSEIDLPTRSSSNIYMTIGNNIYTKKTCDFRDVESCISSTTVVKNNNTELVLHYDEIKHYTYDFFNDFNLAVERNVATVEEKDKAISVSYSSDFSNTEILLNYDDETKQCSYECLNDFNFAMKRDIPTVEDNTNFISISSNSDSTRNYSVSSFNSMGIDFADEIEADTDCEGYHSSDFEFIDETEAGIIKKSYYNNKHNHFKNDYFEATEDDKVNFDEAGPSWLGYDRLESKCPRFNSSMDDSSDALNNNHVIPEGEQLYELFSEPRTIFNYEAENKAFYSNKAMNFDVDNVGFNVGLLQQRHQENEVDDAVKQEALESARKILMLHPIENAKRKRRRF